MANWVTPKIDWISTDFYNYTDLDLIEEDTEHLYEQFLSIGYTALVTSFVYPRNTAYFDFYDSLNRIESNILAIKTVTWEPIVWVTPITNWASVQQPFDYIAVNRLANNIYYLYLMLHNIKDAYLYCGDAQASICGKGNTLF